MDQHSDVAQGPSDRTLRTWAFVGIILWVVVGAGLAIRGVGEVVGTLMGSLTSFLLAGLICALVRPLTRRLKARGFSDGFAAIIGTLAALVVIVLVVAFFIGPIITGASGFLAGFPSAIKSSADQLEQAVVAYQKLPESVKAGAQSALQSLSSSIASATQYVVGMMLNSVTGAFGFGISVFLALILTFWFLKDGPSISRGMLAVLPRTWRDDARLIAQSFDKSFSGYLAATAINVTAIFVLDAIGFSIIKLPYALFLAAVVAVLGVIPYVGSILSAVLAVLVGLAVSPTIGVATGVIVFLVDQFVYSFLGPIVAAKAVSLHPVAVIFALAIGASLAGFVGAILGIPVAAAVRTVYVYYRDRDEPSESADAPTPQPAAEET